MFHYCDLIRNSAAVSRSRLLLVGLLNPAASLVLI